jgi:anti-sigma factor RsiW
MHRYFDGEIEPTDMAELRRHITDCEPCRKVFRRMETTEALVHQLAVPLARPSDDLTAKIMAKLPPQKKRGLWVRWVRRHPAVSVAIVFALVMLGSFTSSWNADSDLTVKGSDLSQVVIEGHTVYVPEGHTVNGDLMVKSGQVEVDGDVRGNLTIIDGSVNMASTAHISGDITRINQALGWLWFKASELVGLFSR